MSDERQTQRQTQLAEVLVRMGGTHTVADILDAVRRGRMQSFVADDDSWAITQIVELPQKRVCEVVLVVGKRTDIDALCRQVEAFARDAGCTLIRAFGRHGWLSDAARHGWRNDLRVYTCDLEEAS